MLKKFLVAFSVVSLFVASSASVNAAQILGSQALLIAGVTPDGTGPDDLQTISSFTFAGAFSDLTASDDFTSFPSLVVVSGSFTLDTVTGIASFGDASFGMFSGATVIETSNTFGSRSFQINGMFAAGTSFPGLQDPTTASFIISFTQAGGPGNSISASGTLVTPALPTSVPEPSTIALAGMAVVGMVVAARRRRS